MVTCRIPIVALALGLLSPPAWAQDPRPPQPPPAAGERTPAPAPPAKQDPEKAKPVPEDGTAATPVPAPKDDGVIRLPEVVVTPSRHATDPFDTPNTVRTLDGAEAVIQRGGRTVPEVAGQITGVEVQKTAQGQGTIFMRGFTGFRTLTLFDGLRVNNSIFRSGPNEWMALIDPYLIDRMEAVEGPGSVLYGSDATGGTVNILTARLLPAADAEIAADAFTLRRRLLYRYSSADRSNTVRGELTGTYGRDFAVRVGGTWREFDDLEGGRHVGLQPMTGFDVVSGDLIAEWRVARGLRLRAVATTLDMDDVWRTHRTVFGVSWHGTSVGSDLARVLDYERTTGALHLEADEVGGWIRDLRVSVLGSHTRKTRDRTRSSLARDVRFVRVNTGGGAAQATTPLGGAARVVYGFDYSHDDVDSGRQDFDAATGLLTSTKIQGFVADDARYDLFGAFAQLEWSVTAWLDLVLGGRFTWADTYAGGVEDPVTKAEISIDDTWTDFSGAGRVLWKPNATERFHVSLAQSFRAPNLSDLTRLDTAQSNELEVPSPGLDPERFLTFEVGLKSRRGPIEMEGAYFYTWITDLIDRTPTGNLVGPDLEVAKTNTGDGFTHGVSGAVRYYFTTGVLTGVSATAGGAWAEGEHDVFVTADPASKNSQPKSKMPPATGFVQLRYESPDGLWWVEGEAKAARAQERLSPADERDTTRTPPGGMPGWAVFSLRGGAQLAEALRVNVGLENLGDRDYRYHGSGVNEPGMHAVLTVVWDF